MGAHLQRQSGRQRLGQIGDTRRVSLERGRGNDVQDSPILSDRGRFTGFVHVGEQRRRARQDRQNAAQDNTRRG